MKPIFLIKVGNELNFKHDVVPAAASVVCSRLQAFQLNVHISVTFFPLFFLSLEMSRKALSQIADSGEVRVKILTLNSLAEKHDKLRSLASACLQARCVIHFHLIVELKKTPSRSNV